MATIIEYKRVHGELVRIKDRNHIYNNLEEFMTNVLMFMYYVDLIHYYEDEIERDFSEQGKDKEQTYLAIEDKTRSIMEEFNEISTWGMDHRYTVDNDPEAYQRGYYFPVDCYDNYPFFDDSYIFDDSYKTPCHYGHVRLHSMGKGIDIWNCEIEEDEERGKYKTSYSLWKYLEEVRQGDLIEYRGYYMQVKDFAKQ